MTKEPKKRGRPAHPGAPPTRLPDGRRNPEYQRWHRRAKPEEYRERIRRAATVEAKKLRDEGKRVEAGQTMCVICKSTYTREQATARAFRFLPKKGYTRCVCDECASGEPI